MTANNDSLPRVRAALERGREERMHIGAQWCVWRAGECLADGCMGESRPGVPMTSDALMPWMSSGKPIAAVAILWQRALLTLDDPVARFLPAFAQRDKQGVTMRHLLTHTAGLPTVEGRWRLAPWAEIIANICEAPLAPDWTPGEKAGYQVASSWYLLAEIIRLVDGRPYQQFARDEIFVPLGMTDSWFAVPLDRYHEYGQRMGRLEPSPFKVYYFDLSRLFKIFFVET